MKKKTLFLALAVGLASTGVVAQQSNPDAAELAEPASPVQSLLGSVGTGASQSKAAASDGQAARTASSGEESQEPVGERVEPQELSAQPEAPKPVAPKPVQVHGAPVPEDRVQKQEPAPAPAAATQEAPLLTPEPALLPQVAVERPVNKVRLTPSERSFLNREEYLLRQIRLLELENQAAELSRKLEGPATGLPQLDSAALSAVAAIDEPVNTAPPFRLISVWGQGGSYRADVLVNGIRLSVSKGEELGDGWRVVDISRNALQIQRGSERVAMKLGS